MTSVDDAPINEQRDLIGSLLGPIEEVLVQQQQSGGRGNDEVGALFECATRTLRVAVIVISVLWFRNPLTATGVTGSSIAIVGVLLYSLAKAQSTPPPKVPPPKARPRSSLPAPSVTAALPLGASSRVAASGVRGRASGARGRSKVH